MLTFLKRAFCLFAEWRIYRNGRATGHWLNIIYRVENGSWEP